MKSNAIYFFIVLCLLLVSCGRNDKECVEQKTRFTVEYSEENPLDTTITIIKDTETDVRYLFVSNKNRGGLTRLEEGDSE